MLRLWNTQLVHSQPACIGHQALLWQSLAPGPSIAALAQPLPSPTSAAAGAQLEKGGAPQSPGPSASTSPGTQPKTGSTSTMSTDAGQGVSSDPTTAPRSGAPSWALPLAAAGLGAAGALLAVAALGCVAFAGLAAARGLHTRGGSGRDLAPCGLRPCGCRSTRAQVGGFAATGPAAGRGSAEPRSLRSLYSCRETDAPCKILVPGDTVAPSHGTHPTRGPNRSPASRHSASAAGNPNGVCHHASTADPGAGHAKPASAASCMRGRPPAAAWPSLGSGLAPAGKVQGQWPYTPVRPPPYLAPLGFASACHSAPAAEQGSGPAGALTLPAMQPVAQRTGRGTGTEDGSNGGNDELAALQNGGCNGGGALANGRRQGSVSLSRPRLSGRLQGTALPPSPFVELTSLPFHN